MPAWKDIDLTNSTVTYNGVTFGGVAAPQRSLPPHKFSLSMQEVLDTSNRICTGLRHVLGVMCIFHEASEAAMATNMAAMRTALSKVGAKLEIRGLGLSFDTVTDIAGGPHPIGMPTMNVLANNAWELLWAVEFTVNPCYDGSNVAKWIQFNYTTSHTNDFEGRCTRSIQGHYQIVHARNPASPNNALPRADVSKGDMQIVLPDGFRRIHNTWQESEDHKTMNFAVTDEQLAGTPLPVDCVSADGDDSFSTNALTWAQASVTMQRMYRVHPGKSNLIAGITFLAEAVAKQNSMVAILPPEAAVIPGNLTIRNGKYESSQITSASLSWTITGCPENFLSAGGLWKRAGLNTYTQWKDSVSSLWANRGNANVTGVTEDDVIIDLCNGATGTTIGRDTATPPNPNPAGALAFSCPDIAEGGGYLDYDVRLRVNREDNQTEHRRATTYTPSDPSGDPVAESEAGTSVALGGPQYTSGSTTEHVIEYNGLPTNIVILRFVAMRYKKPPVMPEVKTVGGLPATLVRQSQEPAFYVGDLMNCPVWGYRGWRIYRINGYIASAKPPGSKVACSSQPTKSDY